jgi:hypothetical protein
MFKNLLQVYALFICAVSSIILLVVLGISLNSITNLLIPDYKNYSAIGRYESDEAYIKFHEEGGGNFGLNKDELQKEVGLLKQLPPQELAQKRADAKKDFLENSRRGSIQSLIELFPWIVLVLFFFFVHWRIYKKASAA